MGIFTKRPVVEYDEDALTASAERIQVDKSGRTAARRKLERQTKAWDHYDQVPEVWFGMNYVANGLRRVRIFPATQPDPAKPPVALDNSTDLGKRANAEMDRLRDVDGSHGAIVHDAALSLSVAGEGYPCGYEDKKEGEVIGIYSVEELVQRDGSWYLLDGEGTQGVQLPSDAVVNRIWRPHPKFRSRADSAMFPLAGTLEELIILDRLFRSSGLTRSNSGIFLVPSEVTMKAPRNANRAPDGKEVDGFVYALVRALTAPLDDESSAANVVPPVIKAKSDLIESFRHMTFERVYDSETAKRYDRLIQRVAMGIDLPPEVITGIEGLNHWSSWQVTDEAFDAHLAPLCQLICGGVTQAFLEPALYPDGDAPNDTEKVFVWYDASGLKAHPNKSGDADAAYDRVAISGEAYRRYKGYTEADVPTEEEIQRRIEIGNIKPPTSTTAENPNLPNKSPN